MLQTQEFLDIKQASAWATAHIGKLVTPSNIAYLINYGRIPKVGANGGTLIDKQDLIDYHEQHAYAYNLFGFERRDAQEIGALAKKQSKQAQADYAQGIAAVLRNARKFLAKDFDIFLVANDKFNLYPHLN